MSDEGLEGPLGSGLRVPDWPGLAQARAPRVALLLTSLTYSSGGPFTKTSP